MANLTLGAAAINQTPIDWENNRSNILNAINKAQENSVDLLCLPELAVTSYGCQDLFLGDWIYQKVEKEIEKLLPHVSGFTAVIGCPISIEGKHYNGAVVIQDKKVIHITLKHWLADDGVHYEPRWFQPWPLQKETTLLFAGSEAQVGISPFEVKGVKVGIEICRDAWKGKERTGHNLIEKGAKLILNPSASHFAFRKTEIREELGLSLTKEHNVAFLHVNLLGNEAGRMIFDGDVQLAQNGILKYKAKRLSMERVSFHTLNLNLEDHHQTTTKNPIDVTYKNEEFTDAATLGLYDYMRKTQSKGFVLSLSGGADSATCALLVAHMVKRGIEELGRKPFWESLHRAFPKEWKREATYKLQQKMTEELLMCVYQATENSSDTTFHAAKKLSESLGAEFHDWSVDDEKDAYTKKVQFVLGRKLRWDTDDIALQNIQSRIRVPGIWMLTNVLGRLLLTTSNRSEASVGYATMDGDTSGSLSPIAGVDKSFIRRYLLWAEKYLGYSGLSVINAQEPTAELRPQDENQTDEDDLMPYFFMTRIERLAIKEWKSPIEVFDILKEEIPLPHGKLKGYIVRFFRLWSRNQWKRERYAPSFHLDDFNVDPKTWCRFPIISGGFEEEIQELLAY